MSDPILVGLPCVIELMGRTQMAGRVTEQAIAGAAFLRVDIPELDGKPGFTKFYSGQAIYAITPVDEPTMITFIRAFRIEPIKPSALPEPEDGLDYDETDDPF